MTKICVVGLGVMGKAIYDTLKKAKFDVCGFERNDDGNKFLKNADVILVAVKPQDFAAFAGSVSVSMKSKLVISIMAGVSISTIKKLLGVEKVVRVMPNLALKVQKSLSGWFASKSVKEKSLVKKILGLFGAEIELKKEDDINLITAISGSGPAYFFYLAECLAKGAYKMGFKKEEAEKIANTVFIGSAELLKYSGFSAENLRKKVTSKKGTTEAAIKTFQKKHFQSIFFSGIKQAYKRANQLNQYANGTAKTSRKS